MIVPWEAFSARMVQVDPAGFVDGGPGIPRDLPGKTVGIREIGSDPSPGWFRRLAQNAPPRSRGTLENRVEIGTLTNVLGEREGEPSTAGIVPRFEAGIVGKVFPGKEREELPPHLEEGDMLVAARMLGETHLGVEGTAHHEITDPEGHEGDVGTQHGRRIGAHDGTMTGNLPARKWIGGSLPLDGLPDSRTVRFLESV